MNLNDRLNSIRTSPETGTLPPESEPASAAGVQPAAVDEAVTSPEPAAEALFHPPAPRYARPVSAVDPLAAGFADLLLNEVAITLAAGEHGKDHQVQAAPQQVALESIGQGQPP